MHLSIENSIIETPKFLIRNIDPKSDSLENYLKWMKDKKSNNFILGVDASFDELSLIKYISEKNSSNSALLLGIFSKENFIHIGNVKFEPIDFETNSTWLGILIGENDYRAKGVGFEVLKNVIDFMADNFLLKNFFLGVNLQNIAAMNLYFKLGFQIETKSNKNGPTVEMKLSI